MAKESLYSVDNRVIFRETFNSFDDIARRASLITAITINNGVATFNGSTSSIRYPWINKGTYSIRMRFKSITLNALTYLIDFSNGADGYIQFTAGNSINNPTGTAYVNGVQIITINSLTKEVVVSGMTVSGLVRGWFTIGSSINGFQSFGGEIELVEIYKGTLTATEVSCLYQGNLYKAPNLDVNTVLDIDPNRGNFEDKKGHTVTNTAVSLVRNGKSLVGKFDGTTSLLAINDTNDLSFGDGITDFPFSIEMWIKPRLIINCYYFSKANEYIVYSGAGGDAIAFSVLDSASGGASYITKTVTFLNKTSFSHIVFTYNGNKAKSGMKIYINSISIGVDGYSPGTYTGMNNSTYPLMLSRFTLTSGGYFNGLYGKTKLYNKELSQTEITRLYNSQKGLYQ